MLEKIADWGWSIVLLLIGVTMTVLTRWIAMLHRHDKQLAILENDHKNRIETNAALVRNVAEVQARLEVHRKESLDRMDSLRRELRNDFQLLIELHQKSEARAEARHEARHS